ncbi:MAG TPA: PDZ domain-containing protein [Candidatus Kapabacteria bacterium]|nr:PDZ domain-containing protein [Candidatus Kapabacteria bacterium]
MKSFYSRFTAIALFAAFIFLVPAAEAQVFAPNCTDSLISHSLDYVDFPPYVQEGPLPPMHPRLGIYFNDVPADSVKMLTGGDDSMKGNRIWHLAPHWSADSAGLMMNDIVLRVDGKELKDSIYGGTDVLNTRLMAMKIGDTMHFQIIRNGRVMMVPVPLLGGHRIPPMKYWDYAGLGPLRKDSWMERTLAEKGLTSWADTIAKQIAAVADFDFCDTRFTKEPNPFRLNAVTYLDHHPTRVGALSRLIDQSVWDSLARGQGMDGAIDAAALELGCLPNVLPRLTLPQTIEELKNYFAETQALLDKAYAPVRSELAPLSWQISELLNTDTNWEDPVDSISDPVLQLQARGKAETMLVHVLGDAAKVDYPDLAAAARRMAALADTNWVHEFALAVMRSLKHSGKPIRPITVPGVDGLCIMEWDSPEGRCVIGGSGPNRYYGDFAMIIDLGGDDVYDLPPCKPGTFRYVADMGGNDLYNGPIASGVGCVDVLVDCNGNDTYRGDQWTQGAGCLGVGILADFGGDDIYSAHWCAQGAAMLGIGLLYDHSGSDHYMADVYSQGFAYTKGFGMLLEREGNDSYRAGWKYPDDRWPNRAHVGMSQGFGFGLRPWSTGVGTDGGIGLLSDKQGDDVYDAGIFTQGGSYWYGLGILHDWRGADRYSAGQYSQGSGIHLSFAALLDDSGDDSYDAYAWLEQGNAHDWSSGCLEDWEGKDTYRCSGAGQGCGFFNSFGYLLDSHGDDKYYCNQSDTTDSQGGGNWIESRHAGSLGMLIDLGKGDDWYSDPRIKQGETVLKSHIGIAYDDGVPEKK